MVGCFYERLVRSVKLCLKKVLGKSLLTYEELETVLSGVEEVINGQPLAYTCEDDLHAAITVSPSLWTKHFEIKES